jgi:hypothetical protein
MHFPFSEYWLNFCFWKSSCLLLLFFAARLILSLGNNKNVRLLGLKQARRHVFPNAAPIAALILSYRVGPLPAPLISRDIVVLLFWHEARQKAGGGLFASNTAFFR